MLRRPKLRKYGFARRDVDDLLQLLAPALPTADVAVPVRDVDDAPVVAAALQGGAERIVTRDLDLADDAELRTWLAEYDIEVVSPVELLSALRLG